MSFVDRAIDFLEAQPAWRYHSRGSAAAEPTAWAAIALAAHGRHEAAARARAWLVKAQSTDGHVGITLEDPSPGWPTPLAVLAWGVSRSIGAASTTEQNLSHPAAMRSAVDWLLSVAGETSAQPEYTGHDTTIAGWPWVAGTHSWVEPTAMGLLALRATGNASHPRARDAVRLLEDRLLTTGGCNYGNTVVLGQTLLAHVEPTGVALLALAGQPDGTGRIALAIEYLESTVGPMTTSASLAYGLLGLAAHKRVPTSRDAWLAACVARSLKRESSVELALLALAALGSDCPLNFLPTNVDVA